MDGTEIFGANLTASHYIVERDRGLTIRWETINATFDSEAWRVPFDPQHMPQPFDHIVRLSTDYHTHTIVGQHWETADLMRSMVHWAGERESECKLLSSFAAWQKSKLDYSAVHTAWLLEAMTQEEFVEEAAKYVVELTDRDPLYVVQVADKLTRLLPFELTTSELAEFLHMEPRAVLESIAMFGQHSDKLRALLPDEQRQLPTE